MSDELKQAIKELEQFVLIIRSMDQEHDDYMKWYTGIGVGVRPVQLSRTFVHNRLMITEDIAAWADKHLDDLIMLCNTP